MKYNRFFNIHIPKTGGTFFRENILTPMELDLNKIGILTNPPSNGGESEISETETFHWCWYKPFITDKTYMYTSLRDPVERLISQYAWQASRAVFYGRTNYTYDDVNKNNFYKWLEYYYDVYKNFQSKNLIFFDENKNLYKESVHLGWEDDSVPKINSFLFQEKFINFKIDKKQLNENIKRIDLIVKSEMLRKEDFQNKIIEKLCDEFNIKNIYKIGNTYGNNNTHSFELHKNFSETEKNKLYEYLDIDSEIYFSNIYNDL